MVLRRDHSRYEHCWLSQAELRPDAFSLSFRRMPGTQPVGQFPDSFPLQVRGVSELDAERANELGRTI